jgi:hypothetical protein
VRCPSGPKTSKRPGGPLSKPSQVAPCQNLRTESSKSTKASATPRSKARVTFFLWKMVQRNAGPQKPWHHSENSPTSFDSRASEGEVTFFLGERVNKTHAHRSLNIKPKIVKVQSQCARVMLVGKSVCTNHSFGSSGLNLACEGLLLGVQGGDRRETPMKLCLTQPTFVFIATVNIGGTFIIIVTIYTSGVQFCRERPCRLTVKLRLGQRSGVQLLERSQSGSRRLMENTSRQRSPRRELPSNGHVSVYD